LCDTFPFSLAAFAASLSGFQILCAMGKQVHQADKTSNFAKLSWNTPIYDWWKVAVRISQNSAAVLGVLTDLLPLLSKIKSRQ
jgi:hypothetical protein